MGGEEVVQMVEVVGVGFEGVVGVGFGGVVEVLQLGWVVGSKGSTPFQTDIQ